MNTAGKKHTAFIAAAGALILSVILVAGTLWMGRAARRDTENAVRTVSLLYLDELAGRREQVVEDNLAEKIRLIQIAIDLMSEEDLRDKQHMEAYQTRMKQLLNLDKFAFVDSEGLIYSSTGLQTNIHEYSFDYKTLSQAEISISDLGGSEDNVVIAVPVDLSFEDRKLSVCFIAIKMEDMLHGISMTTNTGDATFCNLYTSEGTALTHAVLGGLAEEDNLLSAMQIAEFEQPYSYDDFVREFQSGSRGVVSFSYNNIRETLAYIPVSGTDWMLTYLIRESVISERISSISRGAIYRSTIQSLLTVAVMLLMFTLIISQNKRNSRLLLEKETSETASRIKQEELEQRLALQETLLKEKRQREQQSRMITALSADYWSVYYLNLDRDEGVCYQSHADLDGKGLHPGEHFPYLLSVTNYAKQYITEKYREDFLRFVQPESIREKLKNNPVISYTYTVNRHEKETYETVRFARVSRETDPDHIINNVGACFIDVDAETRKAMEQNQALADALSAAEEANKAKTAFLSSMSHEIRTPMNAIIGLDTIALHDPETPEKTRDYLEKIGASAEHLLNLINDILDMTRIESGRLTLRNEEFSFSRLLEAVNTMFSSQCHEKGLDYQCHITGEVDDRYIGDNMKLRQVLINLLGNAVKFTPVGGRVSLLVERTAKFGGKSTLQFTVSDTGIGMRQEFLPHIFDAFSQEDNSATNRYGSSGLGLAITRNIVEMMNGHIEVESTKGKGTVFTVTVTLEDAAQDVPHDADHEIRPGEMSVLVIDDDPVACEHARLVLEKAGIAAETVSSGAEAVNKVQLRHARREPYDLILVDWQMPDMDGIETTRQIRTIVGRESAVIILTAYKWDDILDEAVQAGVDSFIAKPLFASALLEEFETALQRRQLSAQPDGAGESSLAGRRVLLAEDVPVNAEIMTMVLQMRGIETDVAENGRIAVEKFSSHPASYYDAILMDMRMPEMDGLEATRMIRSMDRADVRTIPIIALTANAFDEDVQRSLQAGLNAHLSKPVQPELLFETLEDLLKK